MPLQVRPGHPHEFAQAIVSIIENSILVSGTCLEIVFMLTRQTQNGTYIRLDGAMRLGKL